MRSHLLVFAIFVAPLCAQDKLQTFQAVVTDSRGNSIPGLVADDFRLQDEGKRNSITIFRSNNFKADPSPLAPGQFSNRGPQAGQSATLILLDLLNLTVQQVPYARDRLISALEQVDSKEYVALYFLTSHGLVVGHGFSAAQAPDNTWIAHAASLIDETRGGVISAADRPAATAAGLEVAANVLAEFPGRKNMVWITDGFLPSLEGVVRTEIHSSPFVKRIRTAFSTSGITLYAASGFAGFAMMANGRGGMEASDLNQLTLVSEAAESTGGRAYLDRDISGAVKGALKAKDRPTYTIGFYPQQWDGKAHRLELKCVRKGAVVFAPDRYVADPQLALPGAREKSALDRLAVATFDAPEIGLRVSIAPSTKVVEGIQLAVRIDASDLSFVHQSDSGEYAGELSTTVVYYDAAGHGEMLKRVEHPFHFSAAQYDAAIQSGIGLTQDGPIPATAVRMRIIVFDPHSNAAGSISTPIIEVDRHSPG